MKRLFGGFIIGVMSLTGGSLGWWATQRESPTQVYKIEVLTPQLPPGGELRIRYTVRRSQSCWTRVERVLFDFENTRFPLSTREFSASPGPLGDDSYVVSTFLPETLKEGPAHYRTITTYWCNIVHNIWPIVVTGPDLTFTVSGEPMRLGRISFIR